jgi:hypothetical protein
MPQIDGRAAEIEGRGQLEIEPLLSIFVASAARLR